MGNKLLSKPYEISDVGVAAFYATIGFKYIAERRDGDNIIFLFHGMSYEDIRRYFDNEQVSILDYIEQVKRARRLIFSIKRAFHAVSA